MAPGEGCGLKNGEPVMAGALGGGYKWRQYITTYHLLPCYIPAEKFITVAY